jgi:hypothetical protein
LYAVALFVESVYNLPASTHKMIEALDLNDKSVVYIFTTAKRTVLFPL